MENQRKELHASKAQISNLKMHTKQFGSGDNLAVNDVDNTFPESLDKYKEKIKKLQIEVERLKEKNRGTPERNFFGSSDNEIMQTEDKVIEIHEDQGANSYPVDAALGVIHNEDAQSPVLQNLNEFADKHTDPQQALFNPALTNTAFENIDNVSEKNGGKQGGDNRLHGKPESESDEEIYEKKASPFYLNKSSNAITFWFLVPSFNFV